MFANLLIKAKTRVERIGAMLKGLGRADQRMSVMETHDFGELDGRIES